MYISAPCVLVLVYEHASLLPNFNHGRYLLSACSPAFAGRAVDYGVAKKSQGGHGARGRLNTLKGRRLVDYGFSSKSKRPRAPCPGLIVEARRAKYQKLT
jgi:hypothetical protein